MRLISYRPLLAAVALVTALSGAITLAVFSGGEAPVHAITRHTIEVNAEGFNPRHCNVVRNDEVDFKNVANIAIQVYLPGFGGQPSIFDETLAPGATSSAVSFNAGGSYEFFSDLGDSVTVFTPNGSTGVSACAKEAPTPTPTPTGTATPTATPKPPRPKNCTWNGCAVSLGIAADGE